jgi:glycosyltransferase involved in cell wall biosynthesis
MKWLFIGPRLLSGIGQVTNRYAEMVRAARHDTEFVVFGDATLMKKYDRGFAFVLPIDENMRAIDEYAKLCEKMVYMTICETDPVNQVYGKLAKYKTLWVASDFCKNVFQKQFPEINWKVLRLWAETPIPMQVSEPDPYIFYTIGNIMDPRKNIKALVEAFLRSGFGTNARLVLKATCFKDVDWRVPGVTIINGLLSNEDLEKVHAACHCYINCSHSEGVGMGAVEAALRDKPVIIADFGGLKEYVRTPWVVKCTQGPIGFDDFLFTRDLEWGFPSNEDLMRCLKDCYEKRVTKWDHSTTRELMRSLASCSQEPWL